MFNLILLAFMALASAEVLEVHRDRGGMPVCLEVAGSGGSRHIFVKKSKSKVQFIDMTSLMETDHRFPAPKKCRQWRRVRSGMTDGSLSIDPGPLSTEISRATSQMENGARVFRAEETAEEFLSQHPEAALTENLSRTMKDYGENFTKELTAFWLQSKNFSKSCSELVGTCDYYLCREANAPCGPKGYYLAFGHRYCKKSFGSFFQTVSVKAQTWLTNVATRLQDRLEREVPGVSACGDIRNSAVDSHVACYQETGFCELSVKDQPKIVSLLSTELHRPQMINVGLSIVGNCLKGKK